MSGPIEVSVTAGLAAREGPQATVGEPGARTELVGGPVQAVDEAPGAWAAGSVLLGQYRVGGILGQGGMGTVYRVRHLGWDLDLAVKVPLPEVVALAGGAGGFVREAEAWVNLPLHPHVVSCYYVRRLDGVPGVFAEYVAGGSLVEWIRTRGDRTGRLYDGGPEAALERILDVAVQIGWGLMHAHAHGLVHQDVKPHNVMMTPDGIAKVTDFGLARSQTAAPAGLPAGAGLLVSCGGLTPAYCSPEQAARRPLSPRTDIWSWAASVLEMFAGEVTWAAGPAAGHALEAYLTRDQPGRPLMPGSLAGLLRRCFAPRPEGRPGGMDEVAETLKAIYRDAVGHDYPRREPEAGISPADALNNRAVSLLDLGKGAEAEAAWERALKAEPHHPESSYNLAVRRWRQGRLTDEAAVQRLAEVMASSPKAWLPRHLLALLHRERGDNEAALNVLRSLPPQEAGREEVAAALTGCLEALAKDGPALRWEARAGVGARSISFAPDGRRALTVGFPHEAGLAHLTFWDLEKGGPCSRERLMVTDGDCWGMSFEGRYALLQMSLQRVKLYDAVQRRVLTSFLLPDVAEHAADCPCLAPLAGRLRWLLATRQLDSAFAGHWLMRDLDSRAVSADGRLAAALEDEGRVGVWDVASRRRLGYLDGHRGPALAVAVTPTGKHAVTGGEDGTVRVWGLATGRCLRTFAGAAPVEVVAVSADGALAASLCRKNTLRLWLADAGAPTPEAPVVLCRVVASERVADHERAVQQGRARLDAGDAAAAAACLREARAQPGCARAPEALREWDRLYHRLPRGPFRGWWQAREARATAARCLALVPSQDGRAPLALVGDERGQLSLLDLEAGRALWKGPGHASVIHALVVDDAGQRALTASGDRTLKLWDVRSGRCLRVFRGHRTFVSAASLSADGELVLSGGGAGEVWLWDARTGHRLRNYRDGGSEVTATALIPGGRFAVAGTRKGDLLIWELDRGDLAVALAAHDGPVRALCLSADGRRIITGGDGHTLRLWSAQGHCLRTLRGPDVAVNSVHLSHDGRHALSGGGDGILRLWDTASGRCLAMQEGHAGAAASVALSPEAAWALTCGGDGAVRLWMLEWEVEGRPAAEWDEAATPHLVRFLHHHTPRRATMLDWLLFRLPLRRGGVPRWEEGDFQRLMSSLGEAGLGWLRPEGVRRRLAEMAQAWPAAPDVEERPLELPRSGLEAHEGRLAWRDQTGEVKKDLPLSTVTSVSLGRVWPGIGWAPFVGWLGWLLMAGLPLLAAVLLLWPYGRRWGAWGAAPNLTTPIACIVGVVLIRVLLRYLASGTRALRVSTSQGEVTIPLHDPAPACRAFVTALQKEIAAARRAVSATP